MTRQPHNQHHGMANTRIYAIGKAMRHRCDLETDSSYASYGAKGIKVCEEGDNPTTSFMNFYRGSVEHGYSEEKFESGRGKYSLDRIDGTKGYSPENCRGATAKQQANNRSTTHWVIVNGETKTITEGVKLLHVSPSTLYNLATAEESFEAAIIYLIEYRKSHIYISKNSRHLVCIETSKQYNSSAEASDDLGIAATSIRDCCSGRLHSTHGLHFKYIFDNSEEKPLQLEETMI